MYDQSIMSTRVAVRQSAVEQHAPDDVSGRPAKRRLVLHTLARARVQHGADLTPLFRQNGVQVLLVEAVRAQRLRAELPVRFVALGEALAE